MDSPQSQIHIPAEKKPLSICSALLSSLCYCLNEIHHVLNESGRRERQMALDSLAKLIPVLKL